MMRSLNEIELTGSKSSSVKFVSKRYSTNCNSQAASTYSREQWQIEFLAAVTSFIQLNLSWIHPSLSKDVVSTQPLRVLDYACGPGSATNAMAKEGVEFTGIDLTENMVSQYNTRFATATGFSAKAVLGNLLKPEVPAELKTEEFSNFDIAIISLGFHHFEDTDLAMQRLSERLRPGGVLVIVDFITHAPEHHHSASHTVAHHGFSEEGLQALFERAGLQDFGLVKKEEHVLIKDSPRTVFLGRGVKPRL
jgi:2-polyprenyl-3-methyl-5-hydroxy-6-metoxy-1,4-benzoquinol methylase